MMSAIKDSIKWKYLLAYTTLQDVILRIRKATRKHEYPVDYILDYLSNFLMKNCIAMQDWLDRKEKDSFLKGDWIATCIVFIHEDDELDKDVF